MSSAAPTRFSGTAEIDGDAKRREDPLPVVCPTVGNGAIDICSEVAPGSDQLTFLTRASATTSFTYEANGNLDTRTAGWDYDWNAENLLTVAKQSGAQQQAYVYDGLGRRVKVDGTSASTWTVSIFSGMDVLFEKDQANAVTKYVYANGMRIAKITPTGAVQYYLGDHLGSTRKVLDASRATVFSTDYEPFGKPYNIQPAGATESA